MKGRGVLYVATGQKYIKEVLQSARSVHEYMPDIPMAVFTDDVSAIEEGMFALVEKIDRPEYGYVDKITAFKRSPFERSLFLDTDTLMIEPCYELFEVLDRFDLAATYDVGRSWYDDVACPISFSELSTGMVLFTNSFSVRKFLEEWESTHRAMLKRPNPPWGDQPAFRDALYASDLRFLVLIPEYNLVTSVPYFAGTRVKILHGRQPSLDKVRKVINRRTNPRVGYIPPIYRQILNRLRNIVAPSSR